MRILIADDDQVLRMMLEFALKTWGYEVAVAGNGQEALAILERPDAPRLAILDWMMPNMDGIEVCRRLRQRKDSPYSYIIMLTAKAGKANLITGMEAGADDFIVKPFDSHELKLRLQAGRRIVELQEELIAAREAIQFQATHDPLTGLWNRTAISETFRLEFARAHREGKPLSVAMVDLDHFKVINDTYGHLAGDSVLQEAAHRLEASLRPYDAVGRYGGEEFLVVLPGCDNKTAFGLAERLRASICGAPIQIAERLLLVTTSMGVATTAASDLTDPDTLIRSADEALYRAKRDGRNRVAMGYLPASTAKRKKAAEKKQKIPRKKLDK